MLLIAIVFFFFFFFFFVTTIVNQRVGSSATLLGCFTIVRVKCRNEKELASVVDCYILFSPSVPTVND